MTPRTPPPAPAPPVDLLKPIEVAAMLRLSEQTVRDMCARGEFPGAFRIGRSPQSRVRIPAAAVARWQAAQRPTNS